MMTGVKQQSLTNTSGVSRPLPVWNRLDFVNLAVLLVLELLLFGGSLSHVGFYLDDWLMLYTLKFGPSDFFHSVGNFFLTDPKVIIRPVEAIHFAGLYQLFKIKPLGYHLFNGAFELASIFFLYASVKTLTNNRLASFISAAGLTLYPVRDSSHYWILCSSENLSLSLYLGSLWLAIKGSLERKPYLHPLSWLAFALSLYGYETFLPLAALNGLSAYFIARDTSNKKDAALYAVKILVPFGLCAASLIVYQRMIVPHLGVSYMHILKLDPAQIVHEIVAGIAVTSPFNVLPFSLQQTKNLFDTGVSWLAVLAVIAVSLVVGLVSAALASREDASSRWKELVIAGAVTVVVSFTIFGLNPEYEPTLITIVNRINMGAALGLSLIFAGILSFAAGKLRAKGASKILSAVLLVILFPLSALFSLTNWQLGAPWVNSWTVQKNVFYLIAKNKAKIKDGDTVILANCPRYVLWSPVFDGIWDFQPVVRIALSNKLANGGVVSERMQLSHKDIKDISHNYLCATYSFEPNRLYVLAPPINELVEIGSAPQFIEYVGKNGMKFGLDRKMPEKWNEQLRLSTPAGSAAE